MEKTRRNQAMPSTLPRPNNQLTVIRVFSSRSLGPTNGAPRRVAEAERPMEHYAGLQRAPSPATSLVMMVGLYGVGSTARKQDFRNRLRPRSSVQQRKV